MADNDLKSVGIPSVASKKSNGNKGKMGFFITMAVVVIVFALFIYSQINKDEGETSSSGIEYVEVDFAENRAEVTRETISNEDEEQPTSDFNLNPTDVNEVEQQDSQNTLTPEKIAIDTERLQFENYKQQELSKLQQLNQLMTQQMQELETSRQEFENAVAVENDKEMKKRREENTTIFNELEKGNKKSAVTTSQALDEFTGIEDQIAQLEANLQQSANLLTTGGVAGSDPFGLFSDDESQQDSVNSRIASRSEPITLKATAIANPDYLLAEGTMIGATLDTGVDSTVPGKVRAVINMDVYSFNGNRLLIPKGTMVSGDYIGDMQNGDARIFVVWTTARSRDNVKVPLLSPLADNLGRSGLTGDVESYFWQRYGSSLFLSTIGAATAGNSDDDRLQAAGENFNRSAEVALENSINIKDKFFRNPGAPINIFVNQDVDFSDVSDLVGNRL